MTDGQREAVVRLLTHVRESRGDAIEFDRDELGVRLQQLGAQSAPQAPETSSGGEL